MKVKYNLVNQFFIKRMFRYRGLCDGEISAPGVVILIKDLWTYISPITSQLCHMFVLFVKQRCCDVAEAAFAAVKCSVMRHTIRIAYTCLWWLAIPSVFGLNDEISLHHGRTQSIIYLLVPLETRCNWNMCLSLYLCLSLSSNKKYNRTNTLLLLQR